MPSRTKNSSLIAHRIQLLLSFTLQASILFAFFHTVLHKQWLNGFLILCTFVLTFLPALLKRNYQIYLPLEFEVLVLLFIYASLFLGEIHSYYTLYWWWDIILHGSSGIILGSAGFLLVYILNGEEKIPLNLSPKFIGVFSFLFATAIGSLWEIFEFGIDSIFGFNTQNGSLRDTMFDMMMNTIGALVISFSGFLYLRKSPRRGVHYVVSRFVEKNPKLFEKKMVQKVFKTSQN